MSIAHNEHEHFSIVFFSSFYPPHPLHFRYRGVVDFASLSLLYFSILCKDMNQNMKRIEYIESGFVWFYGPGFWSGLG